MPEGRIFAIELGADASKRTPVLVARRTTTLIGPGGASASRRARRDATRRGPKSHNGRQFGRAKTRLAEPKHRVARAHRMRRAAEE